MSTRQFNTRKILRAIGWAALCLLVVVGFIAARTSTGNVQCKAVDIVINDAADNFFLSEQNVNEWVTDWAGGDVKAKAIDDLKLEALEKYIAKKQWVKAVDVFVDDNATLHINITERQPTARVFNRIGQSFYVDNEKKLLPLQLQMAARVPVFTGFSAYVGRLSRKDSAIIAQVVFLGEALMRDSFLMAMVEQIDINDQGQFEMIPKLGNHIIYLGDTSVLESKFAKLKSFYKNVLAVKGWNTYSSIYLDYKNQVVAKIRDSIEVQADAARTLMLMEMMVTKAKASTADSIVLPKAVNDLAIDSTVLLQSVERDEEEDNAATQSPVQLAAPINNSINPSTTIQNKIVAKPAETKPNVVKPKEPKVAVTSARPSTKVAAKKLPDKNAKAVMPKKKSNN